MNHRRLNTTTLLLDVRRVAEEIGRPPSTPEYIDHGDHSNKTIIQRFNSWDDVLWAAGLDPSDKRDLKRKNRIPTEDLIEELQMAASALERPPTQKEMNEVGICSSGTFIRRFGSWNNALKAADLPVREEIQYTKGNLLDSVLDLTDELGHVPSASEYDAHGLASSSTVCNYWESWTDVTAEVRKRRPNL